MEAILPIRASSRKNRAQCVTQAGKSNPSKPHSLKRRQTEASSIQSRPSKIRARRSAGIRDQSFPVAHHPAKSAFSSPRRQTETILPIRASSGKIRAQLAAQTGESNPSKPHSLKRRHTETSSIQSRPSKTRVQCAAQTDSNKLHPVAPSKIRAQCAAQADGNNPSKPRIPRQIRLSQAST